ncbi:MAG TPA: DUF4476 domain-containing protein [Chitinophagales bacterium]|nr:DUF4476 domain-containing protein [Chitinophagales bacterium]
MKKLSTLLLFSTFLVNSIFASAEFFMKINTNGNYTVSLGNQTLSTSANVFRFFDLANGNYQLRVTENSYNGRVVYDKPIFINDGFRFVAELDAYNGLNIIQKLPFKQQTWYLDNVQTNTPNNQPTCGTPTPPCPKPKYPKPPRNTCNNGNGNGWNSYPNNNGNYNNNNNGWNNAGWNNNGNNYNYNNNNLLSDADLQVLIQTMKNASFEEKMIEVAKTALKDRQLKTTQVHLLLEEITFEANKLELAKFCYDKTIDKNNYYTLYNDFSFSNYSTQLDKYINSR